MNVLKSGAVVACALAAVLTAAPAAEAVSKTWGSKSCVQGSIFVRTTSTGTVSHHINRDSQTATVKTYANGSTARTNTTYTSYARAQSTTATSSASAWSATPSYNCAD